MKQNKAILYKILLPVLSIIFKIYFNPTIVNKEYIPSIGAGVIAGNHKHALDPILVGVSTKRVLFTLAKKDLHDSIFGFFFRAVGSIPVDLRAARNPEALKSAVEKLKDGQLVGVSPEAKRNYTSEILLPFKYGAVSMAKKSHCDIVPYAIKGDYKFRSRNLKITFGKPIDISNMTIEEANKLLFNTIKTMLIES